MSLLVATTMLLLIAISSTIYIKSCKTYALGLGLLGKLSHIGKLLEHSTKHGELSEHAIKIIEEITHHGHEGTGANQTTIR
jgi:hypothetical protein